MSASPNPRRWALLLAVGWLMIAPAGWAIATACAGAAVMLIAGRARAWRRRRAWPSARNRTGGCTVIGSDKRGRPVVLEDSQLTAHGLILGASGAGKSTTLLAILCDQIERGHPVVTVDMKGSPAFARQLTSAAQAAGRRLRVWTLDGPDVWNPLAYGNPTELKDKLIATERFTEPHYQRAAERYAQLLLGVLHELHPERAPTLDEVVSGMDPRRLGGLVRRLPRERAVYLHDYLAALTADQLSAIRGLGMRLAIITESHTGRFLSPPRGIDGDPTDGKATGSHPIDLRVALSGAEIVLFSLNSSMYGKLAAQIGTLVVQDLVTAVGHKLRAGARMPGRVDAVVGIDEFSALGADNVISLLARGREAGTSVLLATQELADLDRAAIGLRDQVLGNTAVKIAHRQDVPASAQTIAQMAGTEKVWEETRQIGAGLFAGPARRGGTRREAEQFLIHPNEIKRLRTGEAVVIAKQPRATVQTVRIAPPRRGGAVLE